MSHILELVCSQLSLFLFINTHRTKNLVDMVHKLIGILIGFGPEYTGGFILVKSLSLLAMVLACVFSLGAPSLVDWVVIANA